jgi:hypothetical protein
MRTSRVIALAFCFAFLGTAFLSASASAEVPRNFSISQKCRSDVTDIFDDGSNIDMHTHADRIQYRMRSEQIGLQRVVEIEGKVIGTGFAPINGDTFEQIFEHFTYRLPFKAWYPEFDTAPLAKRTALVTYLHGSVFGLMPGAVQVEDFGNVWLRDPMLNRGHGYLMLNESGRDETGQFVAHLANGTAVWPQGTSPHVRNVICGVSNLIERMRGKQFDQKIALGHSSGGYSILELAGGRDGSGRKVGIALDKNGRSEIDGVISLSGYADLGSFDPRVPTTSKIFLVGFPDFFLDFQVLTASLLNSRLLDSASTLADAKLASWLRIYHVTSAHDYTESIFDPVVLVPEDNSPSITAGAEISGIVIAAIDNMSAWISRDRQPPPSHIAGNPVLLRDINGDQQIDGDDLDISFVRDGGTAFAGDSTLEIFHSNVAQDPIDQFFAELQVPLADIWPEGPAIWIQIQDLLGSVHEEIVPPGFALRRGTYFFEFNGSNFLADVDVPLNRMEIGSTYGGDRGYEQALLAYLRKLTAKRLWSVDQPVFVMHDKAYLSHPRGQPYKDPGIFGAHPILGVIRPSVDASQVKVDEPGTYIVTYRWMNHVARRSVRVE